MTGFQLKISHKIAALGLLGLAGVGGAIGMYRYAASEQGFFQEQATQSVDTRSRMDRVIIELLNARRAEKDFLLRNDTSYVKRHGDLLRNADAGLADLSQSAFVKNRAVLNEETHSLAQHLRQYAKTFVEVVALREKMGLKPNEGLEGTLRNSVHQVETHLKSVKMAHLDAGMLMMRRHEKDFMLRRDARYIDTFKKSSEDFKGLVGATQLSDAEKGKIIELTRAYVADFVAWAQSARELATQQTGLSEVSRILEAEVEKTRADLTKIGAEAMAAYEKSEAWWSRAVLIFGAGLMLAMGLAAYAIGRAIGRPLASMTGNMRQLASGNTAIDVSGRDRTDEIGEMANALHSFKVAAIEKLAAEAAASEARRAAEEERNRRDGERAAAAAEAQATINAMTKALAKLAEGDLLCQIERPFSPQFEGLRSNFNASIATLKSAMEVVISSVQAINLSSVEFAEAASGLASRTEKQAANLEETAAALDQVTATVGQTAEIANRAQSNVSSTNSAADLTEAVVREAMHAMAGIEKSSTQISQIVSVIDEIAFQTNLLALNAGVEAARAGDAGRGFAVVASEVRALAQRSADAAKEIKVLISASANDVAKGAQLFAKTGTAIRDIVGQIGIVNSAITDIAAGAQEQAGGLAQINTAVNQMDQTTQQNAAMVEETTAASHALRKQIDDLTSLVAQFRVSPSVRHNSLRTAA